MATYKFEALNPDGSRSHGILEADSSQEADRKAKEQGFMLITIEKVSDADKSMMSALATSQAVSEVKSFHSYGWKIRFRQFLVFHVPVLLVAGIGFQLFFAGKPGWLVFIVMVAGLFGFGFAGAMAKARMLATFICPDCQTQITDWDVDAQRNVIYTCNHCSVRWNIGYKFKLKE